MSTAVVRVAKPTPPRTRRWPAPVWALLAGTFITRAAGFTYPFMAYFLADLGYGPGATGAVLAAFGGGWIAGQLACGYLADRIGRRPTLLVAMMLASVVMPLLAESHSLLALLAGALVAGAAYDAPRPVTSAVITDVLPDDASRAAVNSWRHAAINLGAAVAGAVGGLLADRLGYSPLLWLNGAACAIFAGITLVWLGTGPSTPSPASRSGGYRHALRDTRLRWLVGVSLGALTCAMGLFSALPLMMSDDGLPPAAFGLVQVANAASVVVMTPLLSPWLSRRAAGGRPLLTATAAGSLILGIGMGCAAFADTTVMYCLAVIAAIPGEIVFIVSATDVVNRMAPADSIGRYHGVFGMTVAGAAVLAPLLAAWSLHHGGTPTVAATTLAAGLSGAVLCLPLHRALRAS